MDTTVQYGDGDIYLLRMPGREVRFFTDMFIEGLEQFSDGLITAQLGISKTEARRFMTEFTKAMAAARAVKE